MTRPREGAPSGISGTKYLNLVAYAQQLQTLGTPPDNNITIAPDDGRRVAAHPPASALIFPVTPLPVAARCRG
jgi:hypothetical protein